MYILTNLPISMKTENVNDGGKSKHIHSSVC